MLLKGVFEMIKISITDRYHPSPFHHPPPKSKKDVNIYMYMHYEEFEENCPVKYLQSFTTRQHYPRM